MFFFLPHDPLLVPSARHPMSLPQKKQTFRKQRKVFSALGFPKEEKEFSVNSRLGGTPEGSSVSRPLTLPKVISRFPKPGENQDACQREKRSETSVRGFEKRRPPIPPPPPPPLSSQPREAARCQGEGLGVVLGQRSGTASQRSCRRQQWQGTHPGPPQVPSCSVAFKDSDVS